MARTSSSGDRRKTRLCLISFSQIMELLPDFGTFLINNQIDKPFIIRVYNDLMLGQDRVLGWAITGATRQFSLAPIDNHPVPKIDKPYLLTIYLGRGSQTRAEKILARLKTDGLSVVPREDKKYLVTNGQEWVIPLQYLKP
ncbi:MAG: hypothetical protein AAGF26_17195 [Cyanobacteria bacterium P01_G01_bin.49]